MNNIKLSICMPTRNRARFIGEAIESIISQADDRVEIVILDGASTDNTGEVVRSYQAKFSNIVYTRPEENGGVDLDMAKAIGIARGEYCWLFSDDDMLKPGAINRMLKEIETGYEIYLFNITVCSLQMRPIYDRFWLSSGVQDSVFDLHDKSGMIDYCNKANSIGALFSYWSSVVLRRESWNETGFNQNFVGTAYASASVLLSFTKQKCKLKYIRTPLVLWRIDNESFQNEGGMIKRFLLDFDGYMKLADECVSDDPEVRRAFLRVMTREHPWYAIINVTSHIDSPEQWRHFRDKLLKFGFQPWIVNICFAAGRVKNLVSFCVMIKRKLIRSRARVYPL